MRIVEGAVYNAADAHGDLIGWFPNARKLADATRIGLHTGLHAGCYIPHCPPLPECQRGLLDGRDRLFDQMPELVRIYVWRAVGTQINLQC